MVVGGVGGSGTGTCAGGGAPGRFGRVAAVALRAVARSERRGCHSSCSRACMYVLANWSELEFLFVPGLFGTPVDMESKFLPQINWKTGRSVIYEP